MIKDMKSYRNVKVFNNNIDEIIEYLENENKNPTLIITKLPELKKESDDLGRIATTSMLLKSIENNRNENLLRRLFNICNSNCHCYIFTNKDRLNVDYEYMIKAGFIFQDIIVFKTKVESKKNRLFKSGLGYILFFTKESNYFYIRSLNKINSKEPINFIDLNLVNYDKDYPIKIVDRIIALSKLDKLDENLIVDLQSETGVVPKIALENSMECVCLSIGKFVNRKLATYLTGINNKKKDKETKVKKDYKEKNEKISKTMKKTILKNSIKKIRENKE